MCIKVAKTVDTLTLQFKVNPLEKNNLFTDFSNGAILGVRRKWKRKNIKKATISRAKMKGKHLYYVSGYDRYYFKPYPFTGGYNGYSINYCHYKYRDDYILVTIQHKHIANRSYDEIYEDSLTFLKSIGIDVDLLEIADKLNRIDYKRDYEFQFWAEFLAIVNVMSKSRLNYNGVNKELFINIIDNTEYLTGIRYKPNGSYSEILVYYKSLEMQSRRRKHSHVGLNISMYDNVIRTELRLKNKRLYYNKKHTLKIDKTLDNYYSETIADECFKRYVEPIFYTEPFYRLDFALQLIQTDRRLKESDVDKLCNLVIEINQKGFTEAKASYKYSDDTFENHIKRLRSIGINPLCFDEDIDIKFINNFTQKEMCRNY